MVAHKEFVKAWVDAHNRKTGVQGVAEKIGTTVAGAQAKANYLRKKGVNLPRMPYPANAIFDADALNAYITSKLR